MRRTREASRLRTQHAGNIAQIGARGPPGARNAPLRGTTIGVLSSSSSALFYWRSRPTLDESVWLARVTREFQREHPCPSTGRTSGANALSNAITREVRFAIALGSLNVPSATVSPALYPRRCGTGIGPDRDITASRPDIPTPACLCRPRPLVPARTTAENRGFST